MPQQPEASIIRRHGYGAATPAPLDEPVSKNFTVGGAALLVLWNLLVAIGILTMRSWFAVLWLPLTWAPLGCAALIYVVLQKVGWVRKLSSVHEFSRLFIIASVAATSAIVLKGLMLLLLWLIVFNLLGLIFLVGPVSILLATLAISFTGMALDSVIISVTIIWNNNHLAESCRDGVAQAGLLGLLYRAFSGTVALTLYIIFAYATTIKDTEFHKYQAYFLLGAVFSNLVWSAVCGLAGMCGGMLWARSGCDATVTRNGLWKAYAQVSGRVMAVLVGSAVVGSFVPCIVALVHFLTATHIPDHVDSAYGIFSVYISPWYFLASLFPLLVFGDDWSDWGVGFSMELILLVIVCVLGWLMIRHVHASCLHAAGGGVIDEEQGDMELVDDFSSEMDEQESARVGDGEYEQHI
eukprot:TRINITY_DN945_c0_g1_i2.p1 TRINITY_DN945_c0_g1~~TRINITY_DN945_c0_g1_i2.p1  ORF type:complete len:409 (+),score=110.65 TRINITY_DN945_c0_g1_i2:186-1412(+)